MGGLGKAHGNPGPDGGGQADQKRLPGILGGEGGGENRRECGNRPVHQSGKAGLNIGQDELTAFSLLFLLLHVLGRVFEPQSVRQVLMPLFSQRQVTQQLARPGIRRLFGGFKIKPVGLRLHLLGHGAHLFQPQGPDEPVGLALVVAAHMLAPDQRDGFAESLPVHLDQAPSVLALLRRHVVEDLRRLRILFAQAIGISVVNPAVVLFGGNGKRQNFLLGEGREIPATRA